MMKFQLPTHPDAVHFATHLDGCLFESADFNDAEQIVIEARVVALAEGEDEVTEGDVIAPTDGAPVRAILSETAEEYERGLGMP